MLNTKLVSVLSLAMVLSLGLMGYVAWGSISNGAGGGVFAEPYVTLGSNTYGPVFDLTKPTLASFVWRNQGGATVTATNGSVYVTAPGTGGYNWRVREVTCPATPYTIDVTFRAFANTFAVQDYAGIILTDGTKLESFHTGYDFQRMAVYAWTNVTTFSGSVKENTTMNYGAFSPFVALYHFRWKDDGANRTFWYSADHVNYIQFYTEATNTFLTPTTCGFGINTQGTSAETLGIVVYSWKIS